jgi:hypothetical protein
MGVPRPHKPTGCSDTHFGHAGILLNVKRKDRLFIGGKS